MNNFLKFLLILVATLGTMMVPAIIVFLFNSHLYVAQLMLAWFIAVSYLGIIGSFYQNLQNNG